MSAWKHTVVLEGLPVVKKLIEDHEALVKAVDVLTVSLLSEFPDEMANAGENENVIDVAIRLLSERK